MGEVWRTVSKQSMEYGWLHNKNGWQDIFFSVRQHIQNAYIAFVRASRSVASAEVGITSMHDVLFYGHIAGGHEVLIEALRRPGSSRLLDKLAQLDIHSMRMVCTPKVLSEVPLESFREMSIILVREMHLLSSDVVQLISTAW